MATLEQERRRSPPMEPARTASDESQLQAGSDAITSRSAATTMAASAAAATGGGSGSEKERGPEGAVDKVRSSSPWAALLSLSVVSSSRVSSHIASPYFERKRRSHIPRRAAPPSHPWGSKIPVLPPAPAKKKPDWPCPLCGATESPLWRTWPTDRRFKVCNACGIRVRTPGMLLPELVYLPHPVPATATTTTVVNELVQPVAPPKEIQTVSDSPGAVLPAKLLVHLPPPATATATATETVVSELELPVALAPQPETQDSESSPPDSPILDHMLNCDVYLLKRTSPGRDMSAPPIPPPPAAEPAAAPAPCNEQEKQAEKWCLHCGITSTLQWRSGPAGEGTLCNPCGVRYRQGRLVPEYRPKASPTFDQTEHSNKHRQVLKIRRMQHHPAPPAAFKPIRASRKRRKGMEQQDQPAQVRKKRKGNQEQDQPAAQPAAMAVLEVSKKRKSKGKGKEQPQQTPQPAAMQPSAAGDGMGHHLPPPHAAGDMDPMAQHLPPPPAQPHVAADGGELMMGEPIPLSFLFDGPAAPRIIDDDKPIVIVIDDD